MHPCLTSTSNLCGSTYSSKKFFFFLKILLSAFDLSGWSHWIFKIYIYSLWIWVFKGVICVLSFSAVTFNKTYWFFRREWLQTHFSWITHASLHTSIHDSSTQICALFHARLVNEGHTKRVGCSVMVWQHKASVAIGSLMFIGAVTEHSCSQMNSEVYGDIASVSLQDNSSDWRTTHHRDGQWPKATFLNW